MGYCCIVETDGSVIYGESSVDAFLLSHPAGPYTVGRTLRSRKGFVEFDAHVQRISTGISELLHVSTLSREFIRNSLKDILCQSITAAASVGSPADELRVTVLATAASADKITFATLTEALPHVVGAAPAEASPIERHNPGVKDSAWVRQRGKLKARTGAKTGVDEVLLVRSDGGVTEGLSSNFYVVRDGGKSIETAPENEALPGTVRRLVLAACEELGVSVLLKTPKMDESASWEGAFLSSTTRVVRELNIIRFVSSAEATDSKEIAKFDTPNKTVEKVSQKVLELMDKETVDLF